MNKKSKLAVMVLAAMFMLGGVAHALTGTYIISTKGGGGCVLDFTKNGKFTTVVFDPHTQKRYYGHGKYTISGKTLTMVGSSGTVGRATIGRNGDIYDPQTHSVLHRYFVVHKK